MLKTCKIAVALLLAIFIGYIAGVVAYIAHLPAEIRMTEFASHRLVVGVPLTATFNSETAAVAKINDIPVTPCLRLRLNQPLSVVTCSAGTAQMNIGAFGITMRSITLDIVPDVKIVPLGVAIGVRINTDGVMVLGTSTFAGLDGAVQDPAGGNLRAGDLISHINGNVITCKEDLARAIATSTGTVLIDLVRDGTTLQVEIEPAIAISDGVRRIGAWVRDSTKGIGTLTYYDPATSNFGALGHGIIDVDTKKLMSVRCGVIMPSSVTSVRRGARGAPGELEGSVDTMRTIGSIISNSNNGVHGRLCEGARSAIVTREPMPIALRAHINEGPATILTSVDGNNVREFTIYIEAVHRNTTDETKGMVIRITDPELLKITGGIVQGMSGSPILQNGRVAGAITHVFVQDPTKGYGIFIENMLQADADCEVSYQSIV